MPQYEYKCSNCGHITTRTYSIHEGLPAKIACSMEACIGKAARVFSAPAVHFKGKGFYTTDYKRKKEHGAKDESTASKPSDQTNSSSQSPQEIKKAVDKDKKS